MRAIFDENIEVLLKNLTKMNFDLSLTIKIWTIKHKTNSIETFQVKPPRSGTMGPRMSTNFFSWILSIAY
jgi:hypothetical protein